MHDLVFNKLSETQLSITCTYGDHFFVRSEGFPYTFTVDLETTKKMLYQLMQDVQKVFNTSSYYSPYIRRIIDPDVI